MEIAVEFELQDRPLGRLAGKLNNLTYSGAQLITNNSLIPGQSVRLFSVALSGQSWLDKNALVVWTKDGPDGAMICGLKFISQASNSHDVIHYAMTQLTTLSRPRKVILFSLGLLFLGLPTILFFGNRYAVVHGKLAFNIFIFSLVIERLWETFLTDKNNRKVPSTKDWTISAVVFYYILMILGVSIEFYFDNRKLSVPVLFFGSALLLFSYLLRWWGMANLGDQWKIYVGAKNNNETSERHLIHKGPYRLIRHPIYLGVVLELIAIPLTVNAYWTLLFVLLVNIPLQIFRSIYEESELFFTFPKEFVRYRQSTGGFLPVRALSKERNVDHRRQYNLLVDFEDRRNRKN